LTNSLTSVGIANVASVAVTGRRNIHQQGDNRQAEPEPVYEFDRLVAAPSIEPCRFIPGAVALTAAWLNHLCALKLSVWHLHDVPCARGL